MGETKKNNEAVDDNILSRRTEDKISDPNTSDAQIGWEIGTAYDLFISLHVLHQPEKFGLRPSWAAGVRSRLSNEERRTLQIAQKVIKVPLSWIHSYPQPKDAEGVLRSLKQLSPAERLPALSISSQSSDEYWDVLKQVAERGDWSAQDLEHLKESYQGMNKEIPRTKELQAVLDIWADAASFGERYLEALQAYYQVFYSEEQWRILPALQSAVQEAQRLTKEMSLPDLIENLSRGVHIEEYLDVSKLILIPSYWITPLIYFSKLENDSMLLVFGARPVLASLVPGEQVPDPLLLGLKALSDPTRLRILRYLTQENLTPTELARRLRLRPPTVTHHLRALRLAGLVHITLGAGSVNRYSARLGSVDELWSQLKGFLESE